MTDVIEVIVKESGTAQVITSFDSLAAASQRAHTSISQLHKLLGNVGRSTAAANRITGLGTSAQVATGHIGNLNSALNTLSSTRVNASLSAVNNTLGGTNRAAREAAGGIKDFLAAFLSIQTIQGVVTSLINAQKAMQQIYYGLYAATGSAEGAATQMEYLRENANRLGLDLRTSAQEYTRLAASANAMNVEVEDQQRLYTALSQASTVLHLDAQRVQYATLALTQMFSKGKIQAEELRRQLGEAIPGVVPRFQQAVMKVVQGTDLAKYSFEDLMKRGLLDTKQFLPQLIEALTETGRGWEKASEGLNSELNRLKTAWFELKVELSEGIFNDVTIATVRFLSANLKELVGLFAGLGVAISVALAPAAFIKAAGYIKMIGAAVWAAAGPWGILIAAIAGVIGYVVTMRDEIKLGVDDVTTLGDLMRSIWEGVAPAIYSVADAIAKFFGWLSGTSAGTFNELLDHLTNYQHENEATWLKMLRVVLKVFDMIGGVVRGTAYAIWAYITTAIDETMKAFNALGDVASAAMTFDVEGAKAAFNEYVKISENAGKNVLSAMQNAFDEQQILQRQGGLENLLDNRIARAREIALARNPMGPPETAAPPPPPPPPPKPPNTGDKTAERELNRLKEALARVIAQISPTEAATRQLAEAQEVLTKAVDAGLIEQERSLEVMARLEEKFKDVLDPVGALVDKYREEREVLKYVGDEQEIQNVILARYNELKKKNYDITLEYVDNALRPEIEATMAATRANQAYNQVLQQTIYARRAEIEQLQAIADARNNGSISQGQASQQVVSIFGEEAMAGTSEMYAAQLQQYQDFLAQIDVARQQNLISEQTANALSLQAWVDMQAVKLQTAESFFGQMSGLMSSNNKTAFRIGQAAAIAEATINTYKAATGAYSAMAGIPYVGPFLGAAAAAAAVVAGMAQISKIRSQTAPSFRTGGSMVVGGSGGTDSQLVQFNATPGEQVTINTPAQARALERAAEERNEGGRVVNMNMTVVQQGRPDRKTPEQTARQFYKMGRKLQEV